MRQRTRPITLCPAGGHRGNKAHAFVKYGVYYRVDKKNGTRYAVQRFCCSRCHSTYSVLPEHIAPRRWHEWSTQQKALWLHSSGESFEDIGRTLDLTSKTVSRWIKRFKELFLLQADVLRTYRPDLGYAQTFEDFWQAYLKEFSLQTAMKICTTYNVTVS